MKEFHAYLNDDGTYKVETTVTTHYDGKSSSMHVTYPRVQLTMNVLADLTSNKLCIFKPRGD
jgi:hypothetical protein